MKYDILGSSSKGNCIVVEEKIMLDCGLSFSKMKESLKKVKMIFISHSHKDHLNPPSIKKIAYEFPNIKFLTGSKEVVRKLNDNGCKIENIIYISNEKWWDLGLIKIKLTPLTHDIENFALHFEMNNKKGIYIVDTSNVDNVKAVGYDLYLIENNYQEEVLKENIANCTDKMAMIYYERVPKTHLSAEQSNSFLIENIRQNSCFEYIHKSSRNYREEI